MDTERNREEETQKEGAQVDYCTCQCHVVGSNHACWRGPCAVSCCSHAGDKGKFAIDHADQIRRIMMFD